MAGKSGVSGQARKQGKNPTRPKKGGKRPRMRISETTASVLETGDLSDWDDEELRRGQKRDKRGKWSGRPPRLIPKALHDELVRRTLDAAAEEMRSNLVSAVEALTKIAKDTEVEPKDRLKAITTIMDRVMGKAPDKIEVSATIKPWEEALQGGVVRDIEDDDEEDDAA